MPDQFKRLYLTVVDLGREDNGGALVCRNHARRLAEDENTDLTICTFGTAVGRQGAEHAFADSIGAGYAPITSIDEDIEHMPRWPYLMEVQALRQRDIDRQVSRLIDELAPATVVLDYLYTAAFVPSVFRRKDIRRVMITLNDEGRFFRDLQRQTGGMATDFSASLIAEMRLRFFEQATYSRCHHVVALTSSDLPFRRPGMSRSVIQPVFEASKDQWHGDAANDILFVGNFLHYPNRLAIQWLIDKFAPALEAMSSPAVVNIIGAGSDQIADRHVGPNVRLHGLSTNADVHDRLVTCGIFLAPIENKFGSKIKLLDCLSRGTPFAATETALSGMPADGIPVIKLGDPKGAAEIVVALLSDTSRRGALSEMLRTRLNSLLEIQRSGWSKALT